MDTENKRTEIMLTVRDSVNGNKLYEIVKLNGDAEIFDYVVGERRKIKVSELAKWLVGLDI